MILVIWGLALMLLTLTLSLDDWLALGPWMATITCRLVCGASFATVLLLITVRLKP